MRLRRIVPASIAMLLAGGASLALAQQSRGPESAFTRQIAEAHHAEAWHDLAAVRGDFSVHMGGKHLFDATYTFKPAVGPVHMQVKGGPTLVFDGETAWLAPSDSDFKKPRFHLKTWPYFLAVPMKLTDPGLRIEPIGERTYQGQTYETARVTFSDNVGDSPRDWYVIYRHPKTHQLKAMAYIVTYDKSVQKAEQAPHAVVYDDFQKLGGATVSTKWTYYKWNEDQGIHGDRIGHVNVSNLQALDPPATLFEPPEGARRVEPPNTSP